jgi:hypothetical protein
MKWSTSGFCGSPVGMQIAQQQNRTAARNGGCFYPQNIFLILPATLPIFSLWEQLNLSFGWD